MRVQRHARGSVRFDRRRKTWNYLWYESGTRRSKLIGNKRKYPTKASAWAAVAIPTRRETSAAPTVQTLVEQYRVEKMPERYSTRRGYNAWLKNHVLPRWGEHPITDLQARPVELWLTSLALSPKSRAAIRGLLGILWDFAMWRGDVATQRNPIELVTVKNASKRTRQPRSLTAAEFQKLLPHLREPFRTIALVCVCFGLRISECLALKWSDVDWQKGKLCVERGIVRQHVDDVKTVYSKRAVPIDSNMLSVLNAWRHTTLLSAPSDWMFASPVQLGRLPWSYPQVLRVFQKAGADSGIGCVSPHTLRHSYRSWLDSVGTTIAVQQKLMRHADIRTTMSLYGDVVTDEMDLAASKVSQLALNGAQTERKPN